MIQNTELDSKIFKMYKFELFSVCEIYHNLKKVVNQKVIARSIANSELTINFDKLKNEAFYVLPSIINYNIRI